MAINNKRGGFSLVEVALGLLIVGLIMGPMMQQYAAWKNSQFIDLSNGNGATVESALMKYALNNGCYPLPAPPGVAATSAAFGQESVRTAAQTCVALTAAQLAAIPACAANTGVVCQTPCAASATCTAGVPAILIGDVPFQTLGLPKQYILDGYNHKFTYAVSSNLVSPPPSFVDTAGAVKVTDLAGVGPPRGTGPAVTNAHYAIISHGLDGAGAFSIDGGLIANCAGAGKDVENCNNDGTFDNGFAVFNDIRGTAQYGRQESRVAGATHFDDFVFYLTTTSTDIWTKAPAVSGYDIVNHTDPGNVKVKLPATSGPTNPQAKFDVRGDMSADQLWTNNLCDTSGNTFAAGAYTNKSCATAGGFNPAAIGNNAPAEQQATGDGSIHCNMINATTGAVSTLGTIGVPMIGIAAGDELCATVTNAAQVPIQAGYNLAACPGGQYPDGISGGTIHCRTPP